MQRRLLHFWLAALLLCGCSGGAKQDATPAVWAVRDDDTTIYLTGTVHLLPDGVNWRNGPIVEAIAAAQALVTELSPTELSRVAVVSNRFTYGTAVTDPRDRFAPDLRAAFIALEANDLPTVRNMAALDDWALALMLARVSANQAGLNADNGVDGALIAEFAHRNKPRFGLERAEDQFAAFDAIPPGEQRRMLNRLMRDMAEGKADERLRATVSAWAQGDMEKLAVIIARDAADTPGVNRLLLTERNRKWADWMAQRMDEPGTILVAVGAGHLAGPDSLLAMLAARGIEAERLR
ncbi:MAG: TraB/GumN family protein [Sphingopyxis sp.]|nr:TraB/GumN family protein [Sphingopyxis sp.]